MRAAAENCPWYVNSACECEYAGDVSTAVGTVVPPSHTHGVCIGMPSTAEDRLGGAQAAFRGKALQAHPDHVQGDEAAKAAASRRFQQINEAYTTLRDPRRRAAYDRGA